MIAKRLFRGYLLFSALVYVVMTVVFYGKLAAAETIDRALSSGIVPVIVRVAEADPDALATASVGLRRIDTNQLVFCAPGAPGETLRGESDALLNLGGVEIFLQAFSFSGLDCSGVESLGSDDLYRVIFGAPGKPFLLANE